MLIGITQNHTPLPNNIVVLDGYLLQFLGCICLDLLNLLRTDTPWLRKMIYLLANFLLALCACLFARARRNRIVVLNAIKESR